MAVFLVVFFKWHFKLSESFFSEVKIAVPIFIGLEIGRTIVLHYMNLDSPILLCLMQNLNFFLLLD